MADREPPTRWIRDNDDYVTLLPRARAGDAEAMRLLAEVMQTYEGWEENAAEWMRRAAEAGDRVAMDRLGGSA